MKYKIYKKNIQYFKILNQILINLKENNYNNKNKLKIIKITF